MSLKAYRITGYYQPGKPGIHAATPIDFVILSDDIEGDTEDLLAQYSKHHQEAVIWYGEIRNFKP
jgi:hypothetical protein